MINTLPSLSYENRYDKFGFYTVGTFKTYSKFEAIEVSKRVKLPVEWDFNDHVFNKVDWTIEPTESLWELYSARAAQLRQTYDYIVLFFSGGADSTNMVASFLKNNLHVDEIVNLMMYAGSGDKDNPGDCEAHRVAIPKTQKIVEQFPHIKHRIIDMTEVILKRYETDIDFVYDHNAYYSPFASSWPKIRSHFGYWNHLFEQGKKVCFVFANEKPSVSLINGKQHFTFVDKMDLGFSAAGQRNPQPWQYDEYFYSTPDLPTLMVKQGHVVKRYLDNPYPVLNGTAMSDKSAGQFRNSVKTPRYLTLEGLNQVIYPHWDPTTFSYGKQRSFIMSENADWFFNSSSELKVGFLKNVKYLLQQYRSEWLNRAAGGTKQIKKHYCLEK